jgi:hypothetical protein
MGESDAFKNVAMPDDRYPVELICLDLKVMTEIENILTPEQITELDSKKHYVISDETRSWYGDPFSRWVGDTCRKITICSDNIDLSRPKTWPDVDMEDIVKLLGLEIPEVYRDRSFIRDIYRHDHFGSIETDKYVGFGNVLNLMQRLSQPDEMLSRLKEFYVLPRNEDSIFFKKPARKAAVRNNLGFDLTKINGCKKYTESPLFQDPRLSMKAEVSLETYALLMRIIHEQTRFVGQFKAHRK